jgi:hypothetical protein
VHLKAKESDTGGDREIFLYEQSERDGELLKDYGIVMRVKLFWPRLPQDVLTWLYEEIC